MPVYHSQEEYVDQQELLQYQMPKPEVGDIIIWYRNAQQIERREQAAIVTRVGEKVIDLYLVGSGNRVITGVKHVTDPRLRLNDDMREGGSWDFRKSEQKILARINELATKIEAIEDALKPESNGFEERQDLRAKAKDLGIKGFQRMTKDMLVKAIDSCRVDVGQ